MVNGINIRKYFQAAGLIKEFN